MAESVRHHAEPHEEWGTVKQIIRAHAIRSLGEDDFILATRAAAPRG